MNLNDPPRGGRPTQAERGPQGRNAPRAGAAPKPAKAPFLLPLVPDELELSPFLLALLHSAAFLDLSEDEVVQGPAACAVLDRIGLYLQRVDDDTLEQFADDLERLAEYAENEDWPEPAQIFLATFLEHCGFVVDSDGESDDDSDEESDDDSDDAEGGSASDEKPA
jgi:hypothetical protein